jgi:hypothetical protein
MGINCCIEEREFNATIRRMEKPIFSLKRLIDTFNNNITWAKITVSSYRKIATFGERKI